MFTSKREITRPVKKYPKTLTEQSHKKGTDINHLVKTYARSGGLPQVNPDNFRDMPNSIDFHTAMNMAAEVNQKFDSLPSEIRNEFNNDPRNMLQYLEAGGDITDISEEPPEQDVQVDSVTSNPDGTDAVQE
jgi:phage internal scaffolding protein